MRFYILSGQESETVTMKGNSVVKVEKNGRDLDDHSPNYNLVSFSSPDKDGVAVVMFEIFNSQISSSRILISTHSKNVIWK